MIYKNGIIAMSILIEPILSLFIEDVYKFPTPTFAYGSS